MRAEIFSAERLEQHAESLAAAQSVTTRPVLVRPLLGRRLVSARLFRRRPVARIDTERRMPHRLDRAVVERDLGGGRARVGRGGWTWYTGSAAWMYRAGLRWILGCCVHGTTLLLDPCIPRNWPGFQLSCRSRGTRYETAVENPRGVSQGLASLQLDGETLPSGQGWIPLVDVGLTHRVRAVLG